MKSSSSPIAKCLVTAIFILGIQTTVFAQGGQKDSTIRITAKELHAMPARQFLNANSAYNLNSCIVTLQDAVKDLVEYKIRTQAIPAKLKQQLLTVKPGDLIIVESRIAIVDGKEKKLPALIYSIIE